MRISWLVTTMFLALPIPLSVPMAMAAGTESMPAQAPRDPDYEAGKKAIEAQNWRQALEAFHRAASRDSNNADIQNYIGYAYRKSGNLDAAFKHYGEALRLDPKHKGAHEYLGEAYLMANNLQKAEEHLKALDGLCFFPCEEFTDLKRAVEAYKQQRAKRQ